jgi:streptogramin lyase
MSLDSRGRQVGQLTRQLAEARGPVPPFALVRRRHRRRAWRQVALVAAAVITVAAVVTVQVRHQASQDVTSRPRSFGGVAASLHLGGQLSVVRADGAGVWVQRDGEVVRVDPRTNRVTARLQMSPPGSELGAVGDGSLWLTQVAQGTVTRVDPATGRTVATIRVPGAEAPIGIEAAIGPSAVWVTYDLGLGGGIIARVDPATNMVAATVRIPELPGDLAIGDRAVLVRTDTNSSVADLAYQIDPATNRVAAKVPVCQGSNAVASGAGAFWIACDQGTLLRVDPVAHRVAASVGLGGQAGSAGRVVADGSVVWVVNLGDTLFRLDSRSNTIVGSGSVTGPGGGYITDLTVGSDAVWLITSHGTLVRFDPDG